MILLPVLLAKIELSGAPRAGDGPGTGGDAMVWVALGVVVAVILVGAAIAISNWRMERRISEARKAAQLFDNRARRRPLGEERVSSSRVRKADESVRSDAA